MKLIDLSRKVKIFILASSDGFLGLFTWIIIGPPLSSFLANPKFSILLFSISENFIGYLAPMTMTIMYFHFNDMYRSMARYYEPARHIATSLIGSLIFGFSWAAIYFYKIGYEDLLLIPILVNGIGDGLAEPVGVRFGRLKYKTYALFSKIKYERTVEGSACVFFTSVIVIIFFQSGFTSSEFICLLIVFPIVMTLAEAFAPHTWDTPFLFLFGYLTLYIVKIMPFVAH